MQEKRESESVVSPPQTELVHISCENSTVDGHDWHEEFLCDRFAALDFTVELYSDQTYHEGCLKYVPCGMDDDPTCGHRVRSKFPDAKPVKVNGKWMWQVTGLPKVEPLSSPVSSQPELVQLVRELCASASWHNCAYCDGLANKIDKALATYEASKKG